MHQKYLQKHDIDEMARAAMASYEMACCWRRAGDAASEYAADELGVRATSAQVGLAVRLAQTRWEGFKLGVRRAYLQN